MHKSSRSANTAYAAMCALVVLYGTALLMFARSSIYKLPLFFLISGGVVALTALLSAKKKPFNIAVPEQAAPRSRRVFFAAAGFSLFVSLIYLFAYFPGGISPDTVYQWQQIHGIMPLNDWHPALHTMLMGIPVYICDHPAFVLLVQGMLYACAVGYAATSLHRWHMPMPFTMITVLFLSANPAISNVMTFPWKDCALAVTVLFLAAQLFEIHCSKGAWLSGKLRPCLLALMLTLCAILRHNGIALSLAAGVWLLISLPGFRKRAAMTVLLFAALFALIKGPLYSAVGVQKNDTPLDETIGLPMVILSHIYINAPEALDEETVAFLELFGPHEAYVANHRVGNWNQTKWNVSSLPADHNYTLPQVFGFAAKAALKESTLALKALCALIDMPMLLRGSAYWRNRVYVDPSALTIGYEAQYNEHLARIIDQLADKSASPALSWLFWRPGVPLLLVMFFCVLFARRRPLTSLLLPAGMIAYHLATILMLSSYTDFRFFLPTLVIAPLAIAALMINPHQEARR